MMRWIARAAVMGVLLGAAIPAIACTPLQVLEGQGTRIEKKISAPGTPLPYGFQKRNNWNTDFVVSGRAKKYTATIVAKNRGQYRISLYFRYPDNTVDKVYDQTVSLRDNQTVTVSGSPRVDFTPFRINLFVGGTPVVGNTYTASIAACN